MKRSALSFITLFLLMLFAGSYSHIQLVQPLPRGQLRGTKRVPFLKPVDPNAPIDPYPFFPAGDKSQNPGAGKRSQEAAVKFWKVFEPSNRSFPWRAGVCGDLRSQKKQKHKRGGIYYHGGMISKIYKAGTVVDLGVSMNQNHNGYIVFHVCNVAKCGGEINERCFHNGYCRRLERAYAEVCDKKRTKLCGPIDRNHRDRWYIPCAVNAKKKGGIDNYGFKNEMKFKLPKGFTCEHCVLHFYYTSASSCLPPGTAEYFTGPDRPNWGFCKGENRAIGQYAAKAPLCGERLFSEEYYGCADVKIVWKTG